MYQCFGAIFIESGSGNNLNPEDPRIRIRIQPVAKHCLELTSVLRSRNYLFSAPAPTLAIISAPTPTTAIGTGILALKTVLKH